MYFVPSILHPYIAWLLWFMWVKLFSPLSNKILIQLENLISFSFSVTAVRIHQHSAQEYKANRLPVIPKLNGLVELTMKYHFWKDSFILCFVQWGKNDFYLISFKCWIINECWQDQVNVLLIWASASIFLKASWMYTTWYSASVSS